MIPKKIIEREYFEKPEPKKQVTMKQSRIGIKQIIRNVITTQRIVYLS